MLKVILIGAAALFLASCAINPMQAESPSQSEAGSLTPLEPCEFKPGRKTTYQAECGTLTVPENWNDPASRMIELPVVRIPATGPNPAEPVFWLQGGPGAPNLSYAPPAWLLEKHDVIEVGYRGAEGSVVLDCPKLAELASKYIGSNVLGEAAASEMAAASAACAEGFQAQGVDLAGYTVSAVVRDLEAARQALGYERINIYAGSYGTRVAQIYAYLFPQSLHRLMLVGLNTPGRFLYNADEIDAIIQDISERCAADPSCAGRTDDLAQAIYRVNRNMPDRWLFFPIDNDSVRLGMNFMLFNINSNALLMDAYLAADNGDPSGLAMLTLIGKFAFDVPFIYGDLFSKGGSLDGDLYDGPERTALGDSIMGVPLSSFIWSMASTWPYTLDDPALRDLQETDVDILVVNGSLDVSTPPDAIEEARPYWHNAQFIVLDGFGHVNDVESLQPEAFERLMTSYYDTGVADASGYEPNQLSFKPGFGLPLMGKLVAAAAILLPPVLIAGVVLLVRRRRTAQKGAIDVSEARGR